MPVPEHDRQFAHVPVADDKKVEPDMQDGREEDSPLTEPAVVQAEQDPLQEGVVKPDELP
jgi:hypothetical protein